VFSLRVWFRVLKKLELEDQTGVLSWIAFDPDFEPARVDERFKQWVWRGIASYYSIISSGEKQSYQTLSNTFGLEKQDFYRYLQVVILTKKKMKSTLTEAHNLMALFSNAYTAFCIHESWFLDCMEVFKHPFINIH